MSWRPMMDPGGTRFGMAVALGTCCMAIPLDVAQSATVHLTGRFKVVSTIITDSTIPVGTPISVFISGNAFGSGVDKSEVFTIFATLKKTANSQTATFTIPYAWALTDPAGTYHVTASFTPSLAANPSSGISVTFAVVNALPANGATTTITIPVRF